VLPTKLEYLLLTYTALILMTLSLKYSARVYRLVLVLEFIHTYFLSIKVYWFLCFEADKWIEEPCKQICWAGFGNEDFKNIGKSTLAFTFMFFYICRFFATRC